MRRVMMAAALAASAQPVLAADAQHPVELARSGRWVLNVDDDSCSIGASFGEGNGQIVLQMLRYEPADWFELRLIGKPLASDGAFAKLDIGFGKEFDQVQPWVGTNNELPMLLMGNHRILPTPPFEQVGPVYPYKPQPPRAPVTLEQEAAAQALVFSAPSGKWYRLATGSMKNPLTALRDCTRDLVGSWGYDPVQQEQLKRPVTPLTAPNTWLSDADFPQRSPSTALVQFRFDVDEAGKVADCHIQAAIGDEIFRKRTCAIMSQRARLSPALDASGKPVKSYYVNRVKWIWN